MGHRLRNTASWLPLASGRNSHYITQRPLYRVTHQVVPKLSIHGLCNSHTGPESRVWEQPDVSPCIDHLSQTGKGTRVFSHLSP